MTTHDRGDQRVLVKASPFNAEAPAAALRERITPTDEFYVRSNFPLPGVDPAQWKLVVNGLVEHPLNLSLSDIQRFPARQLTATLECAGNNRTRLAPLPEGEPWEGGAVSTATWTGVPLAAVLSEARLRTGAVEVRFEGADKGVPRGRSETIHFERSLPVDVAMAPDTLLVYAMNDAPLTAEHGAPLRVLVPGWYGMSAVKWLQRIEVLDHAFEGHYQTRSYVYERPDSAERPPVRAMRVKSIITDPEPNAVLSQGPVEVRGMTWCGDAAIASVEVSVDAGAWQPAELLDEDVPYTWRRWRFHWAGAPAGRHSLRVRATDAAGRVQPEQPDWNRLGYGNNAIQLTLVTITP